MRSIYLRVFLWFLFTISFLDGVTIAQNFPVDSTKTLVSNGFEAALYLDSGQLRQLDMGLEDAHIYDPVIRTFGYRSQVGNTASNTPWGIIPQLFDVGYRFGHQHALLPMAGSGYYFHPLKAYTRVAYANGAAIKENVIDVGFAKHLGNLLNFGFNYFRVGSLGAYSRQQSIINRLNAYTMYHSKNGRYSAGLEFVWANDDSQDNGGIARDSVFEANGTSDRQFVPVNLQVASHKIVRFEVLVDQRLQLTRADSTNETPTGWRKLVPFLGHKLHFSDQRYTYKDVPDTSATAYYSDVFIDTSSTLDSTKWTKVTNQLVLGMNFNGKLRQTLQAGVAHDWNRVWNMGLVDDIHNLSLVADYGLQIANHRLKADLTYVFIGPNITDTKVTGQYTWQSDSGLVAGAEFLFASRRPDRMFERYFSNNFSWDSRFSNEQSILVKGLVEYPRWRLKADVGYLLLNGLLHFNSDWKPAPATAVNSAIVGSVQEHFKVRWFNLKLTGSVNWFLTGNELRLPPVAARGSLYYDGKIFKKRLRIQVGMDAWFNSSYQPYGYVPALMRFALQDGISTPNYVALDVFLNLEVKRFRGFFKVEHWNAGLMGNNYYMLAHYPMNDLSIKFGINWTFYD